MKYRIKITFSNNKRVFNIQKAETDSFTQFCGQVEDLIRVNFIEPDVMLPFKKTKRITDKYIFKQLINDNAKLSLYQIRNRS